MNKRTKDDAKALNDDSVNTDIMDSQDDAKNTDPTLLELEKERNSKQRILDEAKKTKERLRQLEIKLKQKEDESLEAQGKKDELITSLKNQVNDLSAKEVARILEEKVSAEARKRGCKNWRKTYKAYDGEDHISIDPDTGDISGVAEFFDLVQRDPESVDYFARAEVVRPDTTTPSKAPNGTFNFKTASKKQSIDYLASLPNDKYNEEVERAERDGAIR